MDESPQWVFYCKVFSNDSLKPRKMKQHLLKNYSIKVIYVKIYLLIWKRVKTFSIICILFRMHLSSRTILDLTFWHMVLILFQKHRHRTIVFLGLPYYKIKRIWRVDASLSFALFYFYVLIQFILIHMQVVFLPVNVLCLC